MLLPYGYYALIAGEESSTEWMPHDSFNIVRLASHSHDGIDSALLTSTSFTKVSQFLLSTAWVVSGAGYRQLVTMPVGFHYLTSIIRYFVDKAGDPFDDSEFYPTTQWVTASQFWIYVNDNTIGVEVIYL